MIESAMRRTAPTSLKQFEASKNPIPAALTASPRTGWTFWLIPHSSKISLAFWTRAKSSALAARFSGFWNKMYFYLLEILNLFVNLWFNHFKGWFSTLVVFNDGLNFFEGWSKWGNEEKGEDDSDFHFLEYGIWIIIKKDRISI